MTVVEKLHKEIEKEAVRQYWQDFASFTQGAGKFLSLAVPQGSYLSDLDVQAKKVAFAMMRQIVDIYEDRLGIPANQDNINEHVEDLAETYVRAYYRERGLPIGER